MNPMIIVTVIQKNAKSVIVVITVAAAAVVGYIFGGKHGEAKGKTEGHKEGFEKASAEYKEKWEESERNHKEKDDEYYQKLKQLKERMEFHEDHRYSLKMALTFSFSSASKFELYRRKDDRYFRFIHYNGRNYDDLCEFLQDNDERINIPPRRMLCAGTIYNINGYYKFVSIPNGVLNAVIASNSYLVRKGLFANLMFNYDIAVYLLANYEHIELYSSVEVNNPKVKSKKYTTVKELESIPKDSWLRTHKVWYMIHKNQNIDIESFPQELIRSYQYAEDFYKEFDIVRKNGLCGIKAYRNEDCLEPIYKAIQLDNYRAYVQGEQNLWAIYSLANRRFKTDFIFNEIHVNQKEGLITATKGEEHVVLYSTFSDNSNQIVFENDFWGIKRNQTYLLPCEYDYISLFGDDSYLVFRDGLYGIVNGRGKSLIPLEYEEIDANTPQMALLKVCKNDLWGIISQWGVVYEECRYPKEEIENIYNDAIIRYIERCFEENRIIPNTIINRSEERGSILLNLPTCNKNVVVYKSNLPENVYEEVMGSYHSALKHLRATVIKVTNTGKLVADYYLGQQWLKHRHEMNSLSQSGIDKAKENS